MLVAGNEGTCIRHTLLSSGRELPPKNKQRGNEAIVLGYYVVVVEEYFKHELTLDTPSAAFFKVVVSAVGLLFVITFTR